MLQDESRRASGDVAIDMDSRTSQQLQLIDEQVPGGRGSGDCVVGGISGVRGSRG